jgi:hypothetical protein
MLVSRLFRTLAVVALMSVFVGGISPPARAQDVMSKEAVAALRASFIADIGAMHDKFVQLAQAFPQEKYTWRPMEEAKPPVRSVAEVLMLAAMEGYAFIPTSFGGKPASLGTQEEVAKLRTLSDKAQIIDHINKGFAYAKKELESLDPATLTGKRKLFGQDRSAPDIALFVGGDLHEHLGQLIAYARVNHIVPPWSK